MMDWDDPCPYLVDIITQSPRRADGSRGLTADMFVPIFPNKDPDETRPSVYPSGPDSAPFPRGDCSHWIDGEAWIAFRRVPEGLDNASAYCLPCEGLSLLRATYTKDSARAWDIKTQLEQAARSRGSSHRPLRDGPSPQVSESCPSPEDGGDGICTDAPETDRADDCPGSATSAADDDPFNETFVPLAEFSFDIDWISQTGSLPDVYSFFEEREQIKRWVCLFFDPLLQVVAVVLTFFMKDH